MSRDATREGLLDTCSLRPANVYGYGLGVPSTNSNRGILNEIMHRAAFGETLTLYGEGAFGRDFIFIDDVVDAFCRALASVRALVSGQHLIATGRGYSLAEAFYSLKKRCTLPGRSVHIEYVSEPRELYPIERRNFVGDSTVFQKLTGWRARTDLQSGVRDYFKRCRMVPRGSIAPNKAREPYA